MAFCGLGRPSAEGLLSSTDAGLRKAKSHSHITMQHDGRHTRASCWSDSDAGDRVTMRQKIKNKFQAILGIKRKGTPDNPLISRTSGNVFHDQALVQLASVYESLQLGDSRDAVTQVYDLGERLFGRGLFERAVRDGRLTGLTR